MNNRRQDKKIYNDWTKIHTNSLEKHGYNSTILLFQNVCTNCNNHQFSLASQLRRSLSAWTLITWWSEKQLTCTSRALSNQLPRNYVYCNHNTTNLRRYDVIRFQHNVPGCLPAGVTATSLDACSKTPRINQASQSQHSTCHAGNRITSTKPPLLVTPYKHATTPPIDKYNLPPHS